ncbi:hypothetical protein M434DRAFT_34458 [Hypoxylon sp. CO27-5]|nr:hypothetical protein M434DRAFT_34458 [Hypoxylon sp. CO27-5]
MEHGFLFDHEHKLSGRSRKASPQSTPASFSTHVRPFSLKQQDSGSKHLNAIMFRGFRGGASLCPGRHFATSEILLLATLLLRFDIKPAGRKPWVLPSTAKSSKTEAMEQPDDDVSIELVPRPKAGGKT